MLFGVYKANLPNDNVMIGLLIMAFLPWIATFLQSAKLPGGYELNFRQLEMKVEEQNLKINEQQKEIDSIQKSRIDLEREYLNACGRFDINATGHELDELCTDLKSLAGGLYSLDFLKNEIQVGCPQGNILGVACAIQVRPRYDFLMPITQFISNVSPDPDLKTIRLKVLYRLVMGMENILRIDNKRSSPRLEAQDKTEIRQVLEKLERHESVANDHQSHPRLSLVSRIHRTVSKL